jgi:UDP-N-acetylmuramoyl-L-alanyl-D-glutamate--2,6-diaminopimelate ligase
LKLLGKKAGFISTVQYSTGGTPVNNPEHQTTPEAPIVQRQLYEMLQNGCEYAVVESSSHGLSARTNRLGDVLFDAAVMMNVTQEHLEFHGTLEQYKFDKANLFRTLDKHNHIKNINGKNVTVPSFGVVNTDDLACKYFCNSTSKPVYGFSMKEKDSLNEKNIPANLIDIARNTKRENDSNGSDFFCCGCMLRINLPGEFNIYNTLAASLVVSNLVEKNLLNAPLVFPKYIPEMLSRLEPVCGRMTKIDEGQNFEVIVDYAHTPSSFKTIFPPIRKRAKGNIISLFGSGGERDVQKRPEQGKIADEYSDIIILSDEDPRGEDSYELLEDIAKGIKNKTREENLFIIPDRPKAIRYAFSLAQKDDIVLLLGKSHENSIIFKDHVMTYDEIAEAKKALQEMKK